MPTTARKSRRTTLVPITVMEEVPVLTAAERKALLKSLEEAEARAKAGQAIPYDEQNVHGAVARNSQEGEACQARMTFRVHVDSAC